MENSHPDCACTHSAADHHLDGMAVECWGELAYVVADGRYEATSTYLIAHCDCTVYEPTMAAGSLNLL